MKYKKILWIMPLLLLLASMPTFALTDALAYYSFDTDLTTDDSGNGETGINNGATNTTGKVGAGAADVEDTESDYINVSSFVGTWIETAGSVTYWYKVETAVTYTYAVSLGRDTSSDENYIAGGVGSSTALYIGRNYQRSPYLENRAEEGTVDSNWHHFVITWDNDGYVYFWKDGVNTDNATTSTIGLTSANYGFIGAGMFNGAPANYGDGAIDEVGFWNRQLNYTEIGQLYNSGDGYNPYYNPVDPNSTMTVKAYDTVNASHVTGLCARISNSTHNFSSCNTTSQEIQFTGNQNNVSIGLYNITVYSVGVGTGADSAVYSTNTTFNYNWTADNTRSINVVPLSLVLTFLDEETRSDLIGTDISVSVISSSGNITDFTTNTSNITITGIFEEGDYTVRYTAGNYSLRDFFFTLSLDDPQTVETLYLLKDSVYTPGIVSVRNYDATNVVGAQVIMSRYYGNDTIPNQVQMGTTDGDGNTVFVAESVTAFYTFQVDVDGVTRYSETVPQLLTVDTTGLFSKTITLNRTGVDLVAENTGFSYNFTPQDTLHTDINYNFTSSVSSTSWSVNSCVFNLYFANDTLISSNSSFCGTTGGTGTITYTPVTLNSLYSELIVTTSDFTNTYTQIYSVVNGSRGNFTLDELADDLSAFNSAGFGGFTKFFISMMVILSITFGLSSRSNYINNPEEMLYLIFVLSLGFSYIDWLNINIPNMPIEALNQWFLSILLGLISLMAAINKWGVNN